MLRKLFAAFLVVAGFGMLVPSASAQLPELPVPVPAEVSDALADALAALPNPLVRAIPGVSRAGAKPGGASGSVVENQVVTIGKSESGKTYSKVTVLNIAGQDVLVRNGDATGGNGTYSGHAAQAGPVIDQVNGALCPNGFGTAAAPQQCVVVLYSVAKTNQGAGTTKTNSAQFRAVSIHTDQAPESLTVGSTSASTSTTPFFGTTRCTDIATSFLLSGGGTAAAIILAQPGGVASGIKLSVFKAC